MHDLQRKPVSADCECRIRSKNQSRTESQAVALQPTPGNRQKPSGSCAGELACWPDNEP
jgi:hypothetical protein